MNLYLLSTGTTTIKKVLREMQTLRAGCSKAKPKIVTRHRPPSRGSGTAKI